MKLLGEVLVAFCITISGAFVGIAVVWWLIELQLLSDCQVKNNVYDCHMIAIPTEPKEQPHD